MRYLGRARQPLIALAATSNLPISIKPGDVVRFVLVATSSVSKLAFPDPPIAVPASPKGYYHAIIGKDGLDPFGNDGESVPDGFASHTEFGSEAAMYGGTIRNWSRQQVFWRRLLVSFSLSET
jgi:hypothetical protein